MNKNILSKLNNDKIKSYPQLIDEIYKEKTKLIKEYISLPICFPTHYNTPHITNFVHDYDSLQISMEVQKNGNKDKLIIKLTDKLLSNAFNVSIKFKKRFNKLMNDVSDDRLSYSNFEEDTENDTYTFILSIEMNEVIYDFIKEYYLCRQCHRFNYKNIHNNHHCKVCLTM